MKVLPADQPMLIDTPMRVTATTATGTVVVTAMVRAPRLWLTPAPMSIHRAPTRSVRLPIGPAISAATRAMSAMIVPAVSSGRCRTSWR